MRRELAFGRNLGLENERLETVSEKSLLLHDIRIFQSMKHIETLEERESGM